MRDFEIIYTRNKFLESRQNIFMNLLILTKAELLLDFLLLFNASNLLEKINGALKRANFFLLRERID